MADILVIEVASRIFSEVLVKCRSPCRQNGGIDKLPEAPGISSSLLASSVLPL